jgi:uncharacterized RDD family membrane protein YckC
MSDDQSDTSAIAGLIKIDDDVLSVRLADRSTRLVAAIIDWLIGAAYGIPLSFALGTWKYVSQGESPPLMLLVVASVPFFIGFLLIHGYFLKQNGQTLGKKLTGIRITDLRGNVPRFGTLILLRYVPMTFVPLIPFLGGPLSSIDILFIFRKDRRCIHDLIAGTKVVEVS